MPLIIDDNENLQHIIAKSEFCEVCRGHRISHKDKDHEFRPQKDVNSSNFITDKEATLHIVKMFIGMMDDD